MGRLSRSLLVCLSLQLSCTRARPKETAVTSALAVPHFHLRRMDDGFV